MRHAKIHATNKPFTSCVNFFNFCRCDVCGKSFVDERSLMRHSKIHTFKGCADANFYNFFAGAMFAENRLLTSGP